MARHASTRTDAIETELKRILDYARGAAYNASCSRYGSTLREQNEREAIQHLSTAQGLVETRPTSLQIAFIEAAIGVFDDLGNLQASNYLSKRVLPALEEAQRTRTEVKIPWNL